MADVFTKTQRSMVMARIRGRDNVSTEIRTARLLRAGRVSGWRRHSTIFGKPDFVFQRARVALFVDGCFWHGCPRCNRLPKSSAASAAFWRAKIQGNVRRDRQVSSRLQKDGWKVVRVRECQLKMPAGFLNRLKASILRRSPAR
jgi:DNA mismatch endonuclease (patch repair protein)